MASASVNVNIKFTADDIQLLRTAIDEANLTTVPTLGHLSELLYIFAERTFRPNDFHIWYKRFIDTPEDCSDELLITRYTKYLKKQPDTKGRIFEFIHTHKGKTTFNFYLMHIDKRDDPLYLDKITYISEKINKKYSGNMLIDIVESLIRQNLLPTIIQCNYVEAFANTKL